MKRLIAGLLLSGIFLCGTFASYAVDDGSLVKSELVKKSIDLVAVEPAAPIEVDAPAIQPLSHILAEVNVKGSLRPVTPVANAPPTEGESSPHQSTRIRAFTR